jgi:hypothetical protein
MICIGTDTNESKQNVAAPQWAGGMLMRELTTLRLMRLVDFVY